MILLCSIYFIPLFICLTFLFQIRVCSNHMIYQDEINQVIIHELIHAYDDCRVKNLLWTNCAHLACAEVVMLFLTVNDPLSSYFLYALYGFLFALFMGL